MPWLNIGAFALFGVIAAVFKLLSVCYSYRREHDYVGIDKGFILPKPPTDAVAKLNLRISRCDRLAIIFSALAFVMLIIFMFSV